MKSESADAEPKARSELTARIAPIAERSVRQGLTRWA
jgi:hypothetical protein